MKQKQNQHFILIISSILLMCGSFFYFSSCKQPSSSGPAKPQQKYDDLTFEQGEEPKFMIRFNKGKKNYNFSEIGKIVNLYDANGNLIEYSEKDFQAKNAFSARNNLTSKEIAKIQSHMIATEKNQLANKLLEKSKNKRQASLPVSAPVTTSAAETFTDGDKKSFWIENNDQWEQIEFTCKAQNDKMIIWYDENSAPTQGDLDEEKLTELMEKFSEIYDIEIELFGSNKGYSVYDEERFVTEFNEKLFILISNYSLSDGRKVAGYFSSLNMLKDDFVQSEWQGNHSNEEQIIYIDIDNIVSDFQDSILTCVHEFQHMLGFIHDACIQPGEYETWYTEMLSVFSEDLFHDKVDQKDEANPLVGPYDRLTKFIESTNYGVTYWNNDDPEKNLIGYAVNYAFGAFLFRNYGDFDLLKMMTSHDNKLTNIDAINAALEELGYTKEEGSSESLTFDEIAKQMFSCLTNPTGDKNLNLDREFSETVSGTNIKANKIPIEDYGTIPFIPTGNEILYENGFIISKLPEGIRKVHYQLPLNENDVEIWFIN